ncbi:hypothetical protein CRENBAI_017389 [Crenichthys baileyi]|uniref:Uncharacterized protein n=1 Tax=Crenichthys baileyi TaxID=28760 RepID=A0AAV9RXZ9_9TELE
MDHLYILDTTRPSGVIGHFASQYSPDANPVGTVADRTRDVPRTVRHNFSTFLPRQATKEEKHGLLSPNIKISYSYSSSSRLSPGTGSRGQQTQQRTPRRPSPQTPPPACTPGEPRLPRPAERHSSLQQCPGRPLDLLPVGDVPGTTSEEGVQEANSQDRCPSHLKLAPLDVEEQGCNSEPLPNAELLTIWISKFMAIGEGRNVDSPTGKSSELRFRLSSLFHHNGNRHSAPLLRQPATDPSVDLPLHASSS